MSLTVDYTVRVLDQEIDAIALCPGHSDHVVVATYSLVKTEHAAESGSPDETAKIIPDAQRRVGSLQILPIDFDQSSSTGSTPFHRARRDFPCAILDIHFHPTVTSLLGAATSTGEVRFFDVVWSSGKTDGSDRVEIRPLGKIQLCDDDIPPLITQFIWVDVPRLSSSEHGQGIDRKVCLVTSDTAGQVKVVRLSVEPASHHLDGGQTLDNDRILPFETVRIHKHLHDLEAWTTTSIALPSNSDHLKQLVLSGGDDSCLIASTLEIDTSDAEGFLTESPSRVYLDKHTHLAGVVSIVPLKPLDANSIPLLTGSYDQHLRLFMMSPVTNKLTTTTELELAGGVWRISLLDIYMTSNDGVELSRDWIMLISAMHAGCYIVRLSLVSVEPHESMVYASTAIEDAKQTGQWIVISTSFYDKRVCVWRWTDEKKQPQNHNEAQ